MNQLNGEGGIDRMFGVIVGRPRRQKQNDRAHPFAATAQKVAGNRGNERRITAENITQPAVKRVEIRLYRGSQFREGGIVERGFFRIPDLSKIGSNNTPEQGECQPL